MPQHLAAEYAEQIAEALDSAYNERNVIYRDIKPENLMFDRWEKIKVMDFGLARAPGHLQITIAKTLVGSIYYASPEQVWGQKLDNRSDIYALGAVRYEMVTGHRPFTGRTLPELTQAIVGGTLYPPSRFNPELSPELERIILTAMARNLDERYIHATLMAQDLRALNLRPPPSATLPEQGPVSHSRAKLRETRKGILIRPPKRPQVHRPRYLDLEATQPLLGESREHLSEQPQGEPAREHSSKEQRTNEYADRVPTRPLGPITDVDTRTQQQVGQAPNRGSETRHTFWRQLQRIFRSSMT